MSKKKPVDYDLELQKLEEGIRDHSAALSAMKKEQKQMKRDARTHLICQIGGAALPHLREANLLKASDLEELMAFALKTPDVQAKLNQMLIRRKREKETGETGGTLNILEEILGSRESGEGEAGNVLHS